MNYFLTSWLVFSLTFPFVSFANTANPPRKKVLFFGDSITEGAVYPNGYIALLADSLAKNGKKDDFELLGAGVSGNKIYDLYLRLEDDVLAKKPDVVVIFIGINDVWHRAWGTGTDADKFIKFYAAIIKKLQLISAKVILCTPTVIGERTDFSNQMDGDLNFFAQQIRNLAAQNKLPLCDLRKAFLDYNLANNPTNQESNILTSDRVHLNQKGNLLVANALYPMLFGE